MEEKFKELIEKQHALSNEMEKALVAAVKEKGGYVNVLDTTIDTMYAFLYNELLERYVECPVEAVEAKDDRLFVKLSMWSTAYENDGWFAVSGGMLLINATLYNLCEGLSELLE